MKTITAKKLISALIAAAVLFAMLPNGLSLSASAGGLEVAADALESTGNSTFDAFINDPRFTDGVTWTVDQEPLISGYNCGGCAAYCADFVKFCYGYNNPRAGTAFTDLNETRVGDILIVGNSTDGTGHWLICLKREGDRLFVAEANYRTKVRIGWNYSISNGKLVGTNRKFTMGYHHAGAMLEFICPDVSVSTGYNGEVDVSWTDVGAPYYYVDICDANNTMIEGTADYLARTTLTKHYQLSSSGGYTARVIAMYDGGVYMQGSCWFALTVPTAPTVYTIVGNNGDVEARWNDTGASHYYVYLFDVATQSAVPDTAGYFGSFYARWRLTASGDYVACVIAMYEGGINIQGTSAFTLTIMTAPTVSVEVGDEGAVDVTWNDVGAPKYYARIFDKATMKPVPNAEGYFENFTAHFQMVTGGDYVACVIAMYGDAGRIQGACDFSLPASFCLHDYLLTSYEAPTLESEGCCTYRCSMCGDEYTVILPKLKLGDPDGDGDITVADALDALRVAAKLAEATPELLACCDVDGDEAVTVADALNILRVAAKLVDSL